MFIANPLFSPGKNVIAMIGAGISTAAGIPDFRSPTSGIYSKLGKYNLPSPEAIFEIGYFRPTLSHYFLRLLHEKGLLLRLYTQDFARCDLLIIIGTSLQVQPFAGLVDKVHNSIPRLLINLEKCGQGNLMSKILGLGCGLDFDSEANYRDVALLGTCDSGCRLVADRLGWKDDLGRLVEREEAARIALVEAAAAAKSAAEEATAAATAAVKQQLQKQQQQEESEKKAVA
ncbi:hypothetical protein HPB47_008620, partial [Ixodes persulcatus]